MKVLAGIACAVAMTVAGTAGAQGFGGNYWVEGTNFDGSRYKGSAQIEFTSNTTCRILWKTGETSQGFCMANGNALAAAYSFGNGSVGLVMYDRLPDGTLRGVWTLADQNGFGTETLTPMR